MAVFKLDWFSLALISSILVSFVGVFQKLALKNKDTDPAAFSIYFQFLVGITAFIPALFNFGEIQWNINMVCAIIFMALSYAAANILYFYSLKNTELSQVQIISSTKLLWLVLGGYIFLHEAITLNKLLGISFIMLGMITVYWKGRKFQGFGLPHFFILVYAVAAAATSILDKYILGFFSATITYTAISFLIPSLLTALLLPQSFIKIKTMIKFDKYNLFTFISAGLLSLATFTFFSSLKAGGEISLANPVWQSYIIFSVIFSILFLKERENYMRKIIGAVFILIGVVFIKILM